MRGWVVDTKAGKIVQNIRYSKHFEELSYQILLNGCYLTGTSECHLGSVLGRNFLSWCIRYICANISTVPRLFAQAAGFKVYPGSAVLYSKVSFFIIPF